MPVLLRKKQRSRSHGEFTGLETTSWTPLSGGAWVLLRFGQLPGSPQPGEALALASFGHALDHLSPFHSPGPHPQPTRPCSNHDLRSPTPCFIFDQMLCLFSYPSWPLPELCPLPGAPPSPQRPMLWGNLQSPTPSSFNQVPPTRHTLTG